MRPSATGPKNGKRPPSTRLRTSAVMNTVLPDRASPVTPRRTVGVIQSATVSTAPRRRTSVGWVRSERAKRGFLAISGSLQGGLGHGAAQEATVL